jgi:serine/threonine protein kinase
MRRLGDFETLRELGRGDIAVVYEARHVSLNRKVATKVLSGSFGLIRFPASDSRGSNGGFLMISAFGSDRIGRTSRDL